MELGSRFCSWVPTSEEISRAQTSFMQAARGGWTTVCQHRPVACCQPQIARLSPKRPLIAQSRPVEGSISVDVKCAAEPKSRVHRGT